MRACLISLTTCTSPLRPSLPQAIIAQALSVLQLFLLGMVSDCAAATSHTHHQRYTCPPLCPSHHRHHCALNNPQVVAGDKVFAFMQMPVPAWYTKHVANQKLMVGIMVW